MNCEKWMIKLYVFFLSSTFMTIKLSSGHEKIIFIGGGKKVSGFAVTVVDPRYGDPGIDNKKFSLLNEKKKKI